MLWILGLCASYAFVMTATKKGSSLSFLRQSSLLALVSYGVSWFFGVLYYIHPDTITRFSHAVAPSTNAALYAFFAQSRECIFLSFVLIPILAGVLALLMYFTDFEKKKRVIAPLSITLSILSGLAILLMILIAA
jgi:hypothetical protein